MNSLLTRRLCSPRDISSKASMTKVIDSKYRIVSKLSLTKGISDVFLAEDVENPESKTVIKALKKQYSSFLRDESPRLIKEGEMIGLLDHKNIIKIYSSNFKGTVVSKKRSNPITYLPIEYCPKGDMMRIVKQHTKLNENLSLFIFRQLISAVSYMHSKGICHRDIKLDNILLGDDYEIRLADFEYADFFEEDGKKIKMKSKLGTEQYMAPEMHYLNEEENFYYGDRADIYSCGIVLMTMMTGKLFFECSSPSDYFYRMYCNESEKFFGYVEEFCSVKVVELIKKLIEAEPEKRVTAKEVLCNEIFESVDEKKALKDLKEIISGKKENESDERSINILYR